MTLLVPSKDTSTATDQWLLAQSQDDPDTALPVRTRKTPITAGGAVPIAVVIPSFAPGGSERQMIEVIRRLDSRRWRVHVACFHREGAWLEKAESHAASLVEFPIRGFARPDTAGQIRAFARWCRTREIAVVHAAELYSNIFALPGAAMAGVPVRIGSRRELTIGKTRAQIALQRLAYGCAHKIVANAKAAADVLRRERVPAHKITVIPNGLDLAAFSTAPSRLPRRRIVMVANLRPGKGHRTLIDAATTILAHVPDARFDIVGGGTERDRLMAYAGERGVADAFTFHGHCEDVPARIAAGDIAVLPSLSEAFPNAVLEAMAAGVPVVASAVGGILEVVEDERTGLLVPPGDATALARALERLLQDDRLGTQLAKAGRQTVELRYSFERMIASLDELYTTELARQAAINLSAVSRWRAV
jgi:L-malate glycosyltransferase